MEDKIISFFWGNSKMSWLRYMTLFSFRKYHPDWTINLYTSDQKINDKVWKQAGTQDFISYAGDNYAEKIKPLDINIINYDVLTKDGKEISPSQKSNFFKWNLLANKGGFYADMDILFIRSINELYEQSKSNDIGICFTEYYSIGFMFSNGDNNFFKDVYKECLNNFDSSEYQGAGVYSLSKWPHIGSIEQRYGKVYNIPFNLFYKYDSGMVYKIYDLNNSYELDEECIGLHWYAGHPLSQVYNNEVNADNYKQFDNLISKTIAKILL